MINASPESAHQVRVEVPGSGGGGFGGGLRSLTNEVVVGPSSEARLVLYQPPLSLAGYGARFHVDGRLVDETMHVYTGHPGQETLYTSAGNSVAARRVLVSQAVDVESFPEDEAVTLLRASTPVDAWSDAWLAYSGYDGIVLLGSDLVTAPAGVRSALLRYAETGGALAVLGTRRPPLGSETAAHAVAEESGFRVFYRGFGLVLTSSLETVEELGSTRLAHLGDAWLESRDAWSMLHAPARVHGLFPVVENLHVPVRGLFLVVVAFAVLIGPVNLAVLTRRRRRIHLLWTVPVAALLTSLLVFFYTWVSEGLIQVRSAAALTILDQEGHRAVTWGWAGYYATLTPGRGLLFDRQTEVSPVLEGSAAGGRSVDWSAGQHLAAGWVKARVPSYFVMRKSELRRERLRLREAAGVFEVTNGLGADVTALHLAAADGRVYKAPGVVAAGATVRLEATGSVAGGAASALRQLYRADLPSRLQLLETEPEKHLRPASYVAVLAQNPFLEAGLARADEGRLAAVVYGLLPASQNDPEGE